MLKRFNFFWLGAGALLFVFGANEVAAHYLVRVPRWLGGTSALVGGYATVVAALLVMWLLGIKPPVEATTPETAGTVPSKHGPDARDEGSEAESDAERDQDREADGEQGRGLPAPVQTTRLDA